MPSFVDPRLDPKPGPDTPPPRTTGSQTDLDELRRLALAGHTYEIERYIQAGGPLQIADPPSYPRKSQRPILEIAIERNDYGLVHLLLCNRYDPNLEADSPIDSALDLRRWDLVELLLDWGADPNAVDMEYVYGTYDSKIFEQFRSLGVDITQDHAMASVLAEHTSNKPLFGFAKRHRTSDPKIQTELNMALASHVRSSNEKGVALCLWAGADPHAPTRDFDHGYDDDDDDEYLGTSAIWLACLRGDARILSRLGPDPELDDFDDLYRATRSGSVIQALAQLEPPRNLALVISSSFSWCSLFDNGDWQTTWVLESLFDTGAVWDDASPEPIAVVRRHLLNLSDSTFVRVIKLFAARENCSREVLFELGRTPAIRKRMRAVGFLPTPDNRPGAYRPPHSSSVVRKFGIKLPKPPPRPLPRLVQIGSRTGSRRIDLDRPALFKKVWSQPVTAIAAEWGLSDRGLGKACRRLRVPVPPRGYWAKVATGKRVRRPKLPELAPGEAEMIILWVPD